MSRFIFYGLLFACLSVSVFAQTGIVARLTIPPNSTTSSTSMTLLTCPVVNSNSPGGGVYRWTNFQQVTVAATTSSTYSVTVGWTDNTGFNSFTSTITNGAAGATANGANSFGVFRCIAGSSVTVGISYASVGSTPMGYELYFVVEGPF